LTFSFGGTLGFSFLLSKGQKAAYDTMSIYIFFLKGRLLLAFYYCIGTHGGVCVFIGVVDDTGGYLSSLVVFFFSHTSVLSVLLVFALSLREPSVLHHSMVGVYMYEPCVRFTALTGPLIFP
jgi:hypothetical protein